MILESVNTPKDALVVDIFGGSDAGMFYAMGQHYFQTIKSTRKVFIVLYGNAKKITGLPRLERAHDDDYSPDSFTGLDHPDLFLKSIGINYIEPEFDINKIINAIYKEAGGVNIGKVDKSTLGIPRVMFNRMVLNVVAYKKLNKKYPLAVYVDLDRRNYISFDKFKELYKFWKANPKENMIYINKPVISDKSPFHLLVEEHIQGAYTNFTQFYDIMRGKGYSYYYNDIYPQGQALDRLKNNSGLNCADVAQIGYAVAKDLGYGVRYVRVMCKTGGHIVLQIKGKEIGDNWTWVDLAACISVSGHYDIGDRWCNYAPALEYDPSWLLSDDGKT
jgi:hypothetical protein